MLNPVSSDHRMAESSGAGICLTRQSTNRAKLARKNARSLCCRHSALPTGGKLKFSGDTLEAQTDYLRPGSSIGQSIWIGYAFVLANPSLIKGGRND